jgi:mRNA interferase RelE/StbE
MTYRIQIDKPALKFIAKQPPKARERIMQAIQKLPHEGDIKPLEGRPGYNRLRVGAYRIIYTVQDEIITVRVTSAGNRGDIYK